MKPTNLLLVMTSTMLLSAAALFGGYVWYQSTQEELDDSSSRLTGNVATTTGANVGQGSMQLFAPNSSSTIPLQSSGAVQGTANDATPSPQLPPPSQFSVYEEYANNETALYQDALIGDGNEVMMGDTVAVVYKGWLSSGQLFDESPVNEDGKTQAFSFKLGAGQVIAGWEQAIAGMRVGGERRLVIPSSLGYGEQGTEGIPPNSLLIFDVYLYQIVEQQKPESGL